MTDRLSFLDKTKAFHRSMPRSWPPLTKHIATVLFTYAGSEDGSGITCSVATIADQAGEPERNVQRTQEFMRIGGFLTDEGFYEPRKGVRIPARRLVLEAIQAARDIEQGGVPTLAPGANPGTGRGDSGGTPGGATGGTQTEREDNREIRQPSTAIGHCSGSKALKGSQLTGEFDATFWPLYPRKVAKPKALKAYVRARRGGATVEMIMAALGAYVFSPDPTYRPHPATWLNDAHWQDEPDAAGPMADGRALAADNDYGTTAWAATVPDAKPDLKDGQLCLGGITGRGYYLAGFAADLCEAANMDPTRVAGGLAIVAEWLRAYKDPNWIEAVIKRTRKPAGGVHSLEYFRQPVADAGAKLEADRQDQFAL
jgi:hypothetical protein